MQQSLFERQRRPPVIVACGVGRDSVAMLVEMHNRRWRPDTYRYIPVLQAWLKTHNLPPRVAILRRMQL